MPVKISLRKSTINGYPHILKKTFSRKPDVDIPSYPAIEIIVTKDFDDEIDSYDFDELLISDIDIIVNGHCLYTYSKINKDEYRDKIMIERIIVDHKEKLASDLTEHFTFDVMVKNSFGGENTATLAI